MVVCIGWTEWSSWACSATCGSGKKTRSRICLTPGNCVGDADEEDDCEDLPECPGKYKSFIFKSFTKIHISIAI